MTSKIATPVKGGSVVRDATTGRITEVRTLDGANKRLSEGSLSSVERASAKRSGALKRLADR